MRPYGYGFDGAAERCRGLGCPSASFSLPKIGGTRVVKEASIPIGTQVRFEPDTHSGGGFRSLYPPFSGALRHVPTQLPEGRAKGVDLAE